MIFVSLTALFKICDICDANVILQKQKYYMDHHMIWFKSSRLDGPLSIGHIVWSYKIELWVIFDKKYFRAKSYFNGSYTVAVKVKNF